MTSVCCSFCSKEEGIPCWFTGLMGFLQSGLTTAAVARNGRLLGAAKRTSSHVLPMPRLRGSNSLFPAHRRTQSSTAALWWTRPGRWCCALRSQSGGSGAEPGPVLEPAPTESLTLPQCCSRSGSLWRTQRGAGIRITEHPLALGELAVRGAFS